MNPSIRKHIFRAIVLLYILFIFSNSMARGETSGNLSGRLAALLFRFPQLLGLDISFDAFHFFIRKLAHFSEYLVLALLVKTACIYENKNTGKILPVLLCILVPCIDETIQRFVSGRNGNIRDVLLDMTGYCTGWLLFTLVSKLRKNRRPH